MRNEPPGKRRSRLHKSDHYACLSLHSSIGERKYLNQAERESFIRYATLAPHPVRCFCLTLAHTGCRVSEALALTRDSLRRSEGVLAFRTLKQRKDLMLVREIPIPAALACDLEELLRETPAGDRVRIWKWSRVRAWQLVKVVMTSAGIPTGPHATAKGLRHAFGLHAIRSGVPLNFVQRWLGHASMSTTAIYLQAIGPEERAIAARMWSQPDHSLQTAS